MSASQAKYADNRWQFWIDRGGTFTDVVAQRPDGDVITYKLLSDNPEQYDDVALQELLCAVEADEQAKA